MWKNILNEIREFSDKYFCCEETIRIELGSSGPLWPWSNEIKTSSRWSPNRLRFRYSFFWPLPRYSWPAIGTNTIIIIITLGNFIQNTKDNFLKYLVYPKYLCWPRIKLKSLKCWGIAFQKVALFKVFFHFALNASRSENVSTSKVETNIQFWIIFAISPKRTLEPILKRKFPA